LISATHSSNGFARLFVFERSNNVWTQTKMLHTGIDSFDGNADGLRIALEGNTGEISL
jgi:hypothetical protein